jgi:hypothetical protein
MYGENEVRGNEDERSGVMKNATNDALTPILSYGVQQSQSCSHRCHSESLQVLFGQQRQHFHIDLFGNELLRMALHANTRQKRRNVFEGMSQSEKKQSSTLMFLFLFFSFFYFFPRPFFFSFN